MKGYTNVWVEPIFKSFNVNHKISAEDEEVISLEKKAGFLEEVAWAGLRKTCETLWSSAT